MLEKQVSGLDIKVIAMKPGNQINEPAYHLYI